MKEKFAEWKEKVLTEGRSKWLILLLLGLLLMVISMPVSKEEGTAESMSQIFADEGKEEVVEKSELEKKLQLLLECVEGVGEVRVMIMTGEEKDESAFYNSGQIEVTGVLIAAQGADNYVAVQNIQQAVMALFQVDAHKIKVMKMK